MFPSYSKPLYLLMIFPWFFQLLGSSLPLVALRHRAASRACRSVRTRSKVTFFALSGAGFFIPSSGIITWGIPSEAPKTSKNGQFLGWFSQFFWFDGCLLWGISKVWWLEEIDFFGCCWLLVLLVFLKQRIWAKLWCKSIEVSTLLKSPWRSKSFERRKLWCPLVYHYS